MNMPRALYGRVFIMNLTFIFISERGCFDSFYIFGGGVLSVWLWFFTLILHFIFIIRKINHTHTETQYPHLTKLILNISHVTKYNFKLLLTFKN